MEILTLLRFFGVLSVFFALFIGAVLAIIYLDRRRHADAWRELAQRAGLTFHEPMLFLFALLFDLAEAVERV